MAVAGLVVMATAVIQVGTGQAARAAGTGPAAAAVSAGHQDACYLAGGRVYCTGDGTGLPTGVDPNGALAGVTVAQLASGGSHHCVLSTAGAVYCWGENTSGQLGDGGTTSRDTPVQALLGPPFGGPAGGAPVVRITAGARHTCAVTATGAALCWGENSSGQLGTGNRDSSGVPVAVDAVRALQVTDIAAGGAHTCAVTGNGTGYCWGANGHGQLGDASGTDRPDPVPVAGTGPAPGLPLARVAAGPAGTCALSTAGAAYCWGANAAGQLGDGTSTPRRAPVAVSTSGPLSGVELAAVAVGDEHTCALSTAGRAYCWGANHHGQLGDGTTVARPVPGKVDGASALGLERVTGIAAGGAHTCTVSASGRVYCWGANGGGQLGTADRTDRHAPVEMRYAPAAPTGVTAGPASTALDVSWQASPDLVGGTLLHYAATAEPGGHACTCVHTSCRIGGLTTGTAYTVTVRTVTTGGASVPSVPAGPVRPAVPPGPPAPVVLPGDGQALVSWVAESSRIRADFNGDGIDDIALYYDYGHGDVALFTMTGRATGIDAPVLRWRHHGWGEGTRFVRAGDFDGDGKSDIALWYDYGDGHLRLYTMTAHPDGGGGFSGPVARWDGPAWGTGVQVPALTVGDHNGDGHADLALFAVDGADLANLYTMLAHPGGDGGFDAPVHRLGPVGWGSWATLALAGDFTGDGRDDLGLFYTYAGGPQVALFTLRAHQADDGFDLPELAWSSPLWGSGTQAVTAGDVDGDGRTDVSLLYHHGAGRCALFTMRAHPSGDGGFDAPVERWSSPVWGAGTRGMVAGRHLGAAAGPDVALLYDYGAGRVALFTLAVGAGGGAGPPVPRWGCGAWGTGTRAIL